MDEYNEMYPPWILDDEMELSSSDSSLSGSQELVPAASLLINWINKILGKKIVSLKELADGKVYIQLIRTEFENKTISTVYNTRVNYTMIKKFFKENFSITGEHLNYELAIGGEELEVAKIGLVLMLKDSKNDMAPEDHQLLYIVKRISQQNDDSSLIQIINEFVTYSKDDCENLVKDYILQISKESSDDNNSESDTNVLNLRAEIIQLKQAFNQEKFKNETLQIQNERLQETLSDCQNKLVEEEKLHKKFKQRNQNLKSMLKQYDEQLVQCKKTVDYLAEDYELINRELVEMKKKLVFTKMSEMPTKRNKLSDSQNESTQDLTKQLQRDNTQLKQNYRFYKNKYFDLKKHVLMELHSTIDDITKKNESILVGNANKLKIFEINMENNLKHYKEKYKTQSKEIANLEYHYAILKAEHADLTKELIVRNAKLKKCEISSTEMLNCIKLQTEEIKVLNESLKETKQTNKFLEIKNKELSSTGDSNNNEKQIKDLYDTITEVFIERIEELKSENDLLKMEVKKASDIEP